MEGMDKCRERKRQIFPWKVMKIVKNWNLEAEDRMMLHITLKVGNNYCYKCLWYAAVFIISFDPFQLLFSFRSLVYSFLFFFFPPFGGAFFFSPFSFIQKVGKGNKLWFFLAYQGVTLAIYEEKKTKQKNKAKWKNLFVR